MSVRLMTTHGVRVAVEGCGHGQLQAIYEAVETSRKEQNWDAVDVVFIAGDFQAIRNAADLNVMSVPARYRKLGDFYEYYSGVRVAPYLTIFIGGNHESSSYLRELYYGGWVAPNIYYMGAANIVRLGPLRIAGMSGIWSPSDYRKPHTERLPFSADDKKSIYHVREIDVRKLLQIRTQVDIGLSHDWPRSIEKHGDLDKLLKMNPHFERGSRDGTLGSPAAECVMDHLRPPYWFSGHMHCKFTATKTYTTPTGRRDLSEGSYNYTQDAVPETITNNTVRFLALDKCLPGRDFLELLTIDPIEGENADYGLLQPGLTEQSSAPRLRLQYDPEWLAITRTFSRPLEFGNHEDRGLSDLQSSHLLPQVQAEMKWVEENIIQKAKLDVPENFTITAPIHVRGNPELVNKQPDEYTNAQTEAFCELLGVKNLWTASEERRRQ